jgi:DNA adenine methylase
MSGNISKVIAFNYFGAKFGWVEHLYEYFPSDIIHFVDLFGGSFAVSLNYAGKSIITANEINNDITNFFEVLRNDTHKLITALLLTPCSRAEYEKCWEQSEDPVEQARRFYVRVRQSFYGLGAQRNNKGWHMAKSQVNAKGGETVSRWNNAIDKLLNVAAIIRENFQITNYDYLECIEKTDFSGAFFYCDPPYPKETRASFNEYAFEFTTEQHIELSEALHNIQGRAMISSYDNELYDKLYADWRKIPLPVKKNNIRTKSVQEVIWVNYQPNENQLNLAL